MEKKYPKYGDFRTYVIDSAQKELKIKSDLYFEYKFPKTEGRKIFSIMLTIKCNTLIKILSKYHSITCSKYNHVLKECGKIVFLITRNIEDFWLAAKHNEFSVCQMHIKWDVINIEFIQETSINIQQKLSN